VLCGQLRPALKPQLFQQRIRHLIVLKKMAPNKRRTGSQKSCQRVEYSSQAQAPADMARECIVVDPDTSDNTNDHAGHDSTLKVESEAFGQVNGLHSPLMVCPEVTAEVCKPTDQDSVLDESTPCPPSPRPYPTHQSPEMVCIQASNGPEPIDKKRVRRESSKKQHSWWYNKNKLRLGQVRVSSDHSYSAPSCDGHK
jgi:hypothetical protein